jgi:hypothetical protein
MFSEQITKMIQCGDEPETMIRAIAEEIDWIEEKLQAMRKTCDTCLYWGKPIGNFRLCSNPKIHREAHLPASIDLAPDEAIVEFDEEWGIVTGPKFGCIHHTSCK